MRFCSHSLQVLLGLGAVCGVVVEGHQHQHHGDEAQVPLHEQEYVQDSAEELERKWGFEVGLRFLCLYLGELGFEGLRGPSLVIETCAFALISTRNVSESACIYTKSPPLLKVFL